MKKLIEKEGCIWFEYKYNHYRVFVTSDYWANGLKFWEWCILELLNKYSKYRLTISCK